MSNTNTKEADIKLAPLFVVDTPPFMHKGYTYTNMMMDFFIAMLPAAFMAVYTFGIPALRVMALSVGTAVIAEALCMHLAKRDPHLHDGSAFITGLVFAFLLPAGAPWWIVIIGSAISIILGRQAFGGTGANPLCPPLIGWAIIMLSWPTEMDPSAMTLNTDLVDPLITIKYFGYEAIESSDISLFLGKQLGGLGTTHIAVLLVGGIFLAARTAIRFEIPLAFLLGVVVYSGILWYLDPTLNPPPTLYLLTGSTIFAAFFLATDHASSPISSIGMLIYGFIGGCMVVVIRKYGVHLDGALFAVLLIGLLAPMLDMIRPLPFGKRKK